MGGKKLINRIAKIKSKENSKKIFPRNHGSKANHGRLAEYHI